jgi:nucleoside triphosphate pyrophosphatase
VDTRPAFPPDFRLFLASQSPRRHSLLRDIGVPYEVVSTQAEEIVEGDSAAVLAEANAVEKVHRAFLPAGDIGNAFVLGTDTLVTLEGKVMGKPASAAEAGAMIRALSGATHQVVSGVALLRVCADRRPESRGRIISATASTDVTFVFLRESQIEAYIASGEWADKAGAYGVQGLAGTFVAGVCGEYSNVVGLPLCLLSGLFRQRGFDLLLRQWL